MSNLKFFPSKQNAFGKTYTGREEAARRLIWEENVARIIQHNLRADVGLHSYKRSLNEYADMVRIELIALYGVYKYH